jgi:hypothetical protein
MVRDVRQILEVPPVAIPNLVRPQDRDRLLDPNRTFGATPATSTSSVGSLPHLASTTATGTHTPRIVHGRHVVSVRAPRCDDLVHPLM